VYWMALGDATAPFEKKPIGHKKISASARRFPYIRG